MKGMIWHIYRNQQKGMIRGDDDTQVPFRRSALTGVEFCSISSGQRVYYQIQHGRLGREAGDVRPAIVKKGSGNG